MAISDLLQRVKLLDEELALKLEREIARYGTDQPPSGTIFSLETTHYSGIPFTKIEIAADDPNDSGKMFRWFLRNFKHGR